ncbi:MAG: lysine exporter LysO family protein [Candidatus Cryptobacteroides sp.]
MLEVMISMAIGILAGRLLKIRIMQRAVIMVTWLLLLLLGWEAGSDRNVIEAFPYIGMNALVVALGGVAGSCITAWILWRHIEHIRNSSKSANAEEPDTYANKKALMSGLGESLVILGFFVAGICLGLIGVLKDNSIIHILSFWVLCALMLMVGISIGGNPEIISTVRSMNPRLALLPLATVTGTYAGCLLVNLFVGYRTADVLAIGSGFGYYSLSSVLISGSRGAELGTIALISNIIREVFTLLCSPVVAKIAGPLAPIAAGGATTADTTLPIISSCCGEKYVVLSVFHGLIVDFSVPFLVAFFCSI